MYFSKFPDIIYDPDRDGQFQICKNILRRVALREKVRTNTLLYDTYDVNEGESPESLADRLYGSPEYHWVVLMVNNVTDRYHDWPMSTPQFLEMVADKYDNVDAVHHYEITQESGSTKVKINIGTDNTDYPSATPITNYEYELERQNTISRVRLLDPAYLSQFVTEFETLMKESIL
tara:strand:- start:2493 stop:3020 length:528 start_codon:yes stop_codon:yes gene_type:complete